MDTNRLGQSNSPRKQWRKSKTQEAKEKKAINLVIIGASGAVGREIMNQIKHDEDVTSVVAIVRRSGENTYNWNQQEFKPRITIIAKDNYEDLSDLPEQLRGYNGFNLLFGSQSKEREIAVHQG